MFFCWMLLVYISIFNVYHEDVDIDSSDVEIVVQEARSACDS